MLATHPLGDYLQKHSDPTARGVLFLAFLGNTTANWSNGQYHPGTTPAFDTDGDPTTFSDSEISQMQQIWTRVAEKFSPFNIDVTTVNPGNIGVLSRWQS